MTVNTDFIDLSQSQPFKPLPEREGAGFSPQYDEWVITQTDAEGRKVIDQEIPLSSSSSLTTRVALTGNSPVESSQVPSTAATRASDVQGNDDVVHSVNRDLLYFGVDLWGAIRQAFVIFTSIAEILGKAISPFIPLGMLISFFTIGSANSYATAYWTQPDAKAALEKACELFTRLERMSKEEGITPEKIKEAKEDAQKALKNALEALDRVKAMPNKGKSSEKIIKTAEVYVKKMSEVHAYFAGLPEEGISQHKMTAATTDALTAIKTLQLNVENHKWYSRMGNGQRVLSIENGVAWGLAYKGITFAGLKIIEAVSSVAFGIILLIRGKSLVKRGSENYRIANDFHNAFRQTADPIAFMKDAEEIDKVGPGYLMRRVNSTCLEHLDNKGNTWRCMANGMQMIKNGKKEIANGKIVDLTNNKSYQVEYLKRVDKGIFTEELKHYLTLIIAWSMIIGGIATIAAACIFTGGLPLYITLASAVFFVLMEIFFLTYDSSFLFDHLRDACYWVRQIFSSYWLKQAMGTDFGEGIELSTLLETELTEGKEGRRAAEEPVIWTSQDPQSADYLAVISRDAAKFFEACDEVCADAWDQFYTGLLQTGREMLPLYHQR
jgi:hypothetical protein